MPPHVEAQAERRLERALLAHVRQQFGAPVSAIVGLAEIMLEDVARKGLDAFADDLERILRAGQELQAMIEGLLEPQSKHARASEADFEAFSARLRHDLRNPISAVKGYAEMLIEDAEAADEKALTADLGLLLESADRLLPQIEALVAFGRGAKNAGESEAAKASLAQAAKTALVSETLRTLRPLSHDADAAEEGPPSRILVVDDIASNRDLLSRRLAQSGHQVVTAADGAAALELVAREPFDVILLDLMMPGISGYEALTRLKADPRLRHIPVIMISALDELDSVVRCIEAGAEDYLAKPFNPVLLRARIGACLEKKRLRDREQAYLAQLSAEKKRSEALLLNILPHPIVERMKDGETTIADRFHEVTILFSDLVGFTYLTSKMSAPTVLEMLNKIFSAFDRLAIELGVEKIKTIGDAYMAAAGLPEPRADHANAIAHMALGMHEVVASVGREYGVELKARIGIHSGDVVAGIIGTHKFIYDVWGDTVNTASRMESHGVENAIQVSEVVYERLKNEFVFEARGALEIKGKGVMETYLLVGRKS